LTCVGCGNEFKSYGNKNRKYCSHAIVKKLVASGIKTKHGMNWHESSISQILTNEKYAGDLILQKSYCNNHIEKKKCKNKGELPKFYVKGNHEPIIDMATFESVQQELKRRAIVHHPSKETPSTYPFSLF
jgi:hypothetical protein